MADEPIMTSISELEKALNKFVRESKADVVLVQKKVALDILAGVVKRTPVDTGRARGAWQIGINSPNDSNTSLDPGIVGSPGGKSVTRGASALTKLKPFEVVFLTNNVSYILILEQGGFVPQDPGPSKDKRPGRFGRILVKGGYSVQAPNGMVDVTIQSVLETLR